eukprot:GHVL01017065.1.p1 GENE.GHVL01017065.1~~GHVL01017065.1.p1  ORF type:complete len:487 (-),score=115.49 GHVL01017065.1:64-1524(-)
MIRCWQYFVIKKREKNKNIEQSLKYKKLFIERRYFAKWQYEFELVVRETALILEKKRHLFRKIIQNWNKFCQARTEASRLIEAVDFWRDSLKMRISFRKWESFCILNKKKKKLLYNLCDILYRNMYINMNEWIEKMNNNSVLKLLWARILNNNQIVPSLLLKNDIQVPPKDFTPSQDFSNVNEYIYENEQTNTLICVLKLVWLRQQSLEVLKKWKFYNKIYNNIWIINKWPKNNIIFLHGSIEWMKSKKRLFFILKKVQSENYEIEKIMNNLRLMLSQACKWVSKNKKNEKNEISLWKEAAKKNPLLNILFDFILVYLPVWITYFSRNSSHDDNMKKSNKLIKTQPDDTLIKSNIRPNDSLIKTVTSHDDSLIKTVTSHDDSLIKTKSRPDDSRIKSNIRPHDSLIKTVTSHDEIKTVTSHDDSLIKTSINIRKDDGFERKKMQSVAVRSSGLPKGNMSMSAQFDIVANKVVDYSRSFIYVISSIK